MCLLRNVKLHFTFTTKNILISHLFSTSAFETKNTPPYLRLDYMGGEMTIQTQFKKFNEKIYLTNQSAGYKKASEKDKSILEKIKTAFKDAGHPVINSFCQGSFAVDTAIVSLKGDFDIDRAIVIDSATSPKNPIDPKKVLRDVLVIRKFKNPKIKKPCVTADYTSRNLHIDYTIYKFDGSNYELAVGKEHAADPEWSPSDTKGLIDWINNREEYGLDKINKGKQFKRLVRYMKRWRDKNFTDENIRKKVFSIGLTVMVKEQFKPHNSAKAIENDLQALKNTVDGILSANYIRGSDNKRLHAKLPKSPFRDIFHHKAEGTSIPNDGSNYAVGDQFDRKLKKLQTELQKAIDESDEIKQCTILNAVLGSDFEIPKSTNRNNGNKAVATVSLFPSAGASGTSQGA